MFRHLVPIYSTIKITFILYQIDALLEQYLHFSKLHMLNTYHWKALKWKYTRPKP